MSPRTVSSIAVAAFAIAVAGCGGTDSEQAASTSTSTPTPTAASAATGGALTVRMTEYAFTPSDATAKAGKLTISAPNEGKVAHELVLLKTGVRPRRLALGLGVVAVALLVYRGALGALGVSASYLLYFLKDDQPPMLQSLAHALYWALPRLDRFTIADRVVYGVLPDPSYLVTLVGYSIAYAAIVLLLSIGIFARREFV